MTVIFENFTLNQDRRELISGDQLVAIQPQVFDLLAYVIENRDRVVSRDDLIEHVWNGRIVSESTLATRINAARKALNDNGTDQRLIRTIHGKGIRFIGNLTPIQSSPNPAPPEMNRTEKANLYLPALSFPDGELETIAGEFQDRLTTAIAGDPLYGLILGAPSNDATGYCLTVAFRTNHDQIHLSVKVTNVDTSGLIWAKQYGLPANDSAQHLNQTADIVISRVIADIQLDRSSHAKAKDIDQSSATDLYFKSRSLIRTKIPADNFTAEKLVRRSIKLGPELFGGHMGLAVLYLVRASSVWSADIPGDIEISRQAANAAASADENSVGPFQMLAYIAAYKRQFSAAMEYVGDCERLGTSRASVKSLRGVMLSYQGHYEKALAILESTRLTDSDQKKAYVLNIGRTHFMAGNYDLAVPKLEKYVGQCPAGDLALLFLGNCYDATGHQDKAQACVTRQLSLCPYTTIERISHVTPYTETTLKTFNAFLHKYNVTER